MGNAICWKEIIGGRRNEFIMLKKIKKFSGYYVTAHAKRLKLTHPKWRLFFVLFVAALLIVVNDYLVANYSAVVEANGKARFLPDTLFNWFMTGVVLGIICLALLYEGEFILSLMKMAVQMEAENKEKLAKNIKRKGK